MLFLSVFGFETLQRTRTHSYCICSAWVLFLTQRWIVCFLLHIYIQKQQQQQQKTQWSHRRTQFRRHLQFTNARSTLFRSYFHVYFLLFMLFLSTCSNSIPEQQQQQQQKERFFFFCYFIPLICISQLREFYAYKNSENKKENHMKNDCLGVIRCHHLKFIGNVFFLCCSFHLLPFRWIPFFFAGLACWTQTGKQVILQVSNSVMSVL